ncbi:MAG: SPASM domain-containing protein [Clostridiales Family XIII bacterium]|jgi:pyruvate-formate lyase-activating enzyme|nr:SPASM domain-containing protein [Clostridiales Family XIII bacterium]
MKEEYTVDFEKAKLFPRIVNVNVMAGRCPCRCVHCPVGTVAPEDRLKRFGSKEMSLGLFARIAEEISLHEGSMMRLHSVGEPLLWNNLPEALSILREYGTDSWLFTCAVTRAGTLLSALCESVSIIEVSVNASDADGYRATKGIDAFDVVSENIAFLSGYIRRNGLKTRLLLSRVQTDDEKADERFIAYWRDKDVAADVFVRSYHNYNNILDIRGEAGVKEPCLVHWARASVDCDGAMVCCFNELFKAYTEDVVLGRIDGDTNIARIWNGEKLAAIRSCDRSGDFSPLAFDIPCKNCRTCQPIDTKKETSEKQLETISRCREA